MPTVVIRAGTRRGRSCGHAHHATVRQNWRRRWRDGGNRSSRNYILSGNRRCFPHPSGRITLHPNTNRFLISEAKHLTKNIKRQTKPRLFLQHHSLPVGKYLASPRPSAGAYIFRLSVPSPPMSALTPFWYTPVSAKPRMLLVIPSSCIKIFLSINVFTLWLNGQELSFLHMNAITIVIVDEVIRLFI
jgi:hypothetical protein